MAGAIGLLVFLLVSMALAEEKTGSESAYSPEKPLHITADKMVAHQDESMVEFIGNVNATQDNMLLVAESVKVFWHPSQPDTADTADTADTNRIRQIVATDNVEYTAGDRHAFADKAVYTTADEILILTGKKAKLLTGTSWVTGTKITLFRKQDRVLVESDGKTRVQALFNPEDNPADQ
ncbi:putative lipopolysaccharide export system protein LptA [Desulfotignum phosphitoxidans DSM 13687]|jgi:lipopolysaccharide export system protein LptA|uniref:Putative lipopolysaccharide export system protein LptA n=2 Tax=Desulfotignum phosphitoxidans TaxID=190898 RepID=S0G3R0_9BACT|nr:putative lipopolysaccharide export system protein LptA [Desulfotignum phosphitoxidans DSM 13687]